MSDDFSSDINTIGTVAVGGTAEGNIETARDRDWFAVELVAGREHQIDLRGSATDDGTLSDPLALTVRASDGSETVDTTVTVNVTDVEETADPPAAEEDEGSSTLDTVSEPGDGDFSAATSTSGRVVVGETATGLRVRQTTTTAPAQPSLLPTGSILRASPLPRPACAFLREIGTSAPLSIY